jgi:hypothetical protein
MRLRTVLSLFVDRGWGHAYMTLSRRVMFYLGYRSVDFERWILDAQLARVGRRMKLRHRLTGWFILNEHNHRYCSKQSKQGWWPEVKEPS